MSELRECPFCNEKNTVVRLKRDGKPTGMIGHACRVLNLEIRASETAWNVRAERTCENFGLEKGTNGENYDFACSACGYCADVTEPDYCPSCGARVVRS